MTEVLVEVRRLTKTYRDVAAVDGVDLTIRRGEIYGLLGPNGAGKTTTLRILLGLVRPSGGIVRVLSGPPGHPETLARVGMLVEQPGFYPYLSGRDNLRVLARYAFVSASRVDEVLETVDLRDRARHRFGTYSLGMKQRLGVAAALLKDPELLILDEPTNGLDPAGMADMRALIGRLRESGATIVFSSHLLGDVERVCDRIGLMANGKLLLEGTVADILAGGAGRSFEDIFLDLTRKAS